jgi:chemotaxis signal transduction protein
LGLDAVRGVLPAPLLQPLAGAPGFLEGFFDYRGGPVAALRLDRLLDLDEDTLGLYSPLILLAASDPPIALHVALADGVASVDSGAVQPIGAGETFNGCVAGRVSEGGETAYLLRAENILLAAERETIAAHAAMRAKRLAALDGGERAA